MLSIQNNGDRPFEYRGTGMAAGARIMVVESYNFLVVSIVPPPSVSYPWRALSSEWPPRHFPGHFEAYKWGPAGDPVSIIHRQILNGLLRAMRCPSILRRERRERRRLEDRNAEEREEAS